jgi:type II secretory pathway predicted ATPase ExeA
VIYFAEAKRLGATGLVKVVGEALRVRTSMCHAVNFDRLLRTLSDAADGVMLWLDEAHDLPDETLAEARALAESNLDGSHRVQVMLVGLPKLRASLQACDHLWRRIVVREEITGLVFEELADFLDHHFEPGHSKRLCERGLASLFERARGVPGLLLPMYRAILDRAGSAKAKIEADQVDDTLERWDLA